MYSSKALRGNRLESNFRYILAALIPAAFSVMFLARFAAWLSIYNSIYYPAVEVGRAATYPDGFAVSGVWIIATAASSGSIAILLAFRAFGLSLFTNYQALRVLAGLSGSLGISLSILVSFDVWALAFVPLSISCVMLFLAFRQRTIARGSNTIA